MTRGTHRTEFHMPKTFIFQEPASGKDHILTLPCVIGRGAEAGLSLSDSAVSHRHALVEEMDGGIWVRDLGSTNGVFVNDVRIHERTALQAGDVLRLGERELILSSQEEDFADRTVILPLLEREQELSPDLQRLRFIYELCAEVSVDKDLNTMGEKITSR